MKSRGANDKIQTHTHTRLVFITLVGFCAYQLFCCCCRLFVTLHFAYAYLQKQQQQHQTNHKTIKKRKQSEQTCCSPSFSVLPTTLCDSIKICCLCLCFCCSYCYSRWVFQIKNKCKKKEPYNNHFFLDRALFTSVFFRNS